MPSGKGIRAGKAYVELAADDKKLVRGLQRASRRLKAFGAGVQQMGMKLAGMGAVIGGGLLAATKTFASMGDQVSKMAARTGLSTEALSELGFAAEQSGSNIEDLEKGIRTMQRSINDAGRGLSTAVDALDDLGLTYKQLQNLSPEDQFKLIADRIGGVADPSKRAATAMMLLGRAGTKLLPMFAGGAKGIEALQQQARELGLTISTESAGAAAKFTDQMNILWKVLKMGVFVIGSALGPVLSDLSNWIVDATKKATAWLKQNKQIIVTILKVAASIAALGVAALVIGKIVTGIGSIVGALAFLAANPIVLVIAGIVAAAVAIDRLQTHTAELSSEMEKLRQAGDKQRAVDLARIKRLDQLADKEQLNNTEMAESRDLIDKLQGRYGDLGIVLDETTGKLNGVAEAHGRLAKAMRRAALAQVDAEIAERRGNIQELRKEQSSMPEGLISRFRTGKMESLGGDIRQQMQYVRALQMRREAIVAGDEGALVGGSTDEKTKLQDRLAAGRSAAQANEEWTRRAHRLELQQIEDAHKREIALINERYDYEIKRAEALVAAQATLDTINKARKLELAAAEKKAQDDLAAKKLRQLDSDSSRRQTIQELELRNALKGFKLEKALLELEGKRAIEAAKAAGEQVGLVKNEYALRQKLLAASAGLEGAKSPLTISARGTFNAAATSGLAGAGAVDRIAKATEGTNNNTKRLVEVARRGGPAFA